jgi:hypothetical protein
MVKEMTDDIYDFDADSEAYIEQEIPKIQNKQDDD